eukprot:COSAG02_NODE_71_length_42019_cov_36.443893_19_plen_3171_part_00
MWEQVRYTSLPAEPKRRVVPVEIITYSTMAAEAMASAVALAMLQQEEEEQPSDLVWVASELLLPGEGLTLANIQSESLRTNSDFEEVMKAAIAAALWGAVRSDDVVIDDIVEHERRRLQAGSRDTTVRFHIVAPLSVAHQIASLLNTRATMETPIPMQYGDVVFAVDVGSLADAVVTQEPATLEEAIPSGCRDSLAENFDAEAWVDDDSSCEYDRIFVGDHADVLVAGAVLERWFGTPWSSVTTLAALPDFVRPLNRTFSSVGTWDLQLSDARDRPFSQRIRGLFAPTISGEHTFVLNCGSTSILKFSGGHRAVGASTIARTSQRGTIGWSARGEEKVIVTLQAGELYYMETIQDLVRRTASPIQVGVIDPEGNSFFPIQSIGSASPDVLSMPQLCAGAADLSSEIILSANRLFVDGMRQWTTAPPTDVSSPTEARMYFEPDGVLLQPQTECDAAIHFGAEISLQTCAAATLNDDRCHHSRKFSWDASGSCACAADDCNATAGAHDSIGTYQAVSWHMVTYGDALVPELTFTASGEEADIDIIAVDASTDLFGDARDFFEIPSVLVGKLLVSLEDSAFGESLELTMTAPAEAFVAIRTQAEFSHEISEALAADGWARMPDDEAPNMLLYTRLTATPDSTVTLDLAMASVGDIAIVLGRRVYSHRSTFESDSTSDSDAQRWRMTTTGYNNFISTYSYRTVPAKDTDSWSNILSSCNGGTVLGGHSAGATATTTFTSVFSVGFPHEKVRISFKFLLLDQTRNSVADLTVDGVEEWRMDLPMIESSDDSICGSNRPDRVITVSLLVEHRNPSLELVLTNVVDSGGRVINANAKDFVALDDVVVETVRAESGHAKALLTGELWPDGDDVHLQCGDLVVGTFPLHMNVGDMLTTTPSFLKTSTGCTDSHWANNFSPDAWVDDGSCQYSCLHPPNCECGGLREVDWSLEISNPGEYSVSFTLPNGVPIPASSARGFTVALPRLRAGCWTLEGQCSDCLPSDLPSWVLLDDQGAEVGSGTFGGVRSTSIQLLVETECASVTLSQPMLPDRPDCSGNMRSAIYAVVARGGDVKRTIEIINDGAASAQVYDIQSTVDWAEVRAVNLDETGTFASKRSLHVEVRMRANAVLCDPDVECFDEGQVLILVDREILRFAISITVSVDSSPFIVTPQVLSVEVEPNEALTTQLNLFNFVESDVPWYTHFRDFHGLLDVDGAGEISSEVGERTSTLQVRFAGSATAGVYNTVLDVVSTAPLESWFSVDIAVTVVPGAFSPRHSNCEAIGNAIAGRPWRVRVTARDTYSNAFGAKYAPGMQIFSEVSEAKSVRARVGEGLGKSQCLFSTFLDAFECIIEDTKPYAYGKQYDVTVYSAAPTTLSLRAVGVAESSLSWSVDFDRDSFCLDDIDTCKCAGGPFAFGTSVRGAVDVATRTYATDLEAHCGVARGTACVNSALSDGMGSDELVELFGTPTGNHSLYLMTKPDNTCQGGSATVKNLTGHVVANASLPSCTIGSGCISSAGSWVRVPFETGCLHLELASGIFEAPVLTELREDLPSATITYMQPSVGTSFLPVERSEGGIEMTHTISCGEGQAVQVQIVAFDLEVSDQSWQEARFYAGYEAMVRIGTREYDTVASSGCDGRGNSQRIAGGDAASKFPGETEASCNDRAVAAGAHFAQYCPDGVCTLYSSMGTCNLRSIDTQFEYDPNHDGASGSCMISAPGQYLSYRGVSGLGEEITSVGDNMTIVITYSGSEAEDSDAAQLYASPMTLSWTCVQVQNVCAPSQSVVALEILPPQGCVVHWQIDNDWLATFESNDPWVGPQVHRDVVAPPGNSTVHRLVYRGMATAIKVTTLNDTLLALRVVSGVGSPECADSICAEHGQAQFTSPVGEQVVVYVHMQDHGTISWFIDEIEHPTTCVLLPGDYSATIDAAGWVGVLEVGDSNGGVHEVQLDNGGAGRRLSERSEIMQTFSFAISDDDYILGTLAFEPVPVTCETGESPSADGTACECLRDTYDRPVRARLGQINPSGRRACLPCPSGMTPEVSTDMTTNDASSCTVCESGYSNAETGFICQTCPPGQVPSPDKSHCNNCPPGTYGQDGLKCSTCLVWAIHSIAPPAGLEMQFSGARDESECACPPGFYSFSRGCQECSKISVPQWISDEVGTPEYMLSPNVSLGEIPDSPLWNNQTHQTCPGGWQGASPICPIEGYYVTTFPAMLEHGADSKGGIFRLSDRDVEGNVILALAVPCHGGDKEHCVAASSVGGDICRLPTADKPDIVKCAEHHVGMICAGCDESDPDVSYVRIKGHCTECDGIRIGPILIQMITYLLIAGLQVMKSLGDLKQNAASDTVLFLVQTLALVGKDSFVVNSGAAGMFDLFNIDPGQSFGQCTLPVGVYGQFFLKVLFVPAYLFLCVHLCGTAWNKLQDLHEFSGVEKWIKAHIPASVERELEMQDKRTLFDLQRVVCRAIQDHMPDPESGELEFHVGDTIVITHVGDTRTGTTAHWPAPEQHKPAGADGHTNHDGDDVWYGYKEDSELQTVLVLASEKLDLMSLEQANFWANEHPHHERTQQLLTASEKVHHILWKVLHKALMAFEKKDGQMFEAWNERRAFVRVAMFIYMPFSRSAMEMLLCSAVVPGDEKRYLKRDLAQECGTGWHIMTITLSLLLLLVIFVAPLAAVKYLFKLYNNPELPLVDRSTNGVHKVLVKAKHLQDNNSNATTGRGPDDIPEDEVFETATDHDLEEQVEPLQGADNTAPPAQRAHNLKQRVASARGHAKTFVKTERKDLIDVKNAKSTETERDYFVDLHCYYHPNRWWWFVMLLMRKNLVNVIYLRGYNADDNFDWRLALVLALACFVCLEIEVEPYVEHIDNLMDVIVMVVLMVVLHINASEQFYASSAVTYGLVMLIVVFVVGIFLALMTRSLSKHQKKHAQMRECNDLRAKAHRTQHGSGHSFDADGDGELDREELFELFDKLDANGDGRVSQKELSTLIRGHKMYMVVADQATVHAEASQASNIVGSLGRGMVVTALEEQVVEGYTRIRIGSQKSGGPWIDRITHTGEVILEEVLAEEELQTIMARNVAKVTDLSPASDPLDQTQTANEQHADTSVPSPKAQQHAEAGGARTVSSSRPGVSKQALQHNSNATPERVGCQDQDQEKADSPLAHDAHNATEVPEAVPPAGTRCMPEAE